MHTTHNISNPVIPYKRLSKVPMYKLRRRAKVSLDIAPKVETPPQGCSKTITELTAVLKQSSPEENENQRVNYFAMTKKQSHLCAEMEKQAEVLGKYKEELKQLQLEIAEYEENETKFRNIIDNE